MKKKKIKISSKLLAGSAYLYMIIPIIIFFVGWLKPILAILFSMLLIIGFISLMKNNYNKDVFFEIPLKALILVLICITFWVAISGIGGFWFQKWDWHWRNAFFRDMVDYTWPVIYPETGNALIYYFIYFMVPALIGKIAGWTVANVALYIWTCIGVLLAMLLLCEYLKCYTTKTISIALLIFIIWEGLDIVGWAGADIFGYNSMALGDGWDWAIFLTGYQYSPNNTLLAWVTNQTVVPWIAILLFLENRNIRTYAFLGLCVLPFAPLPFIGLFVILVSDAIRQFIARIKQKAIVLWLKDIISISNVCAILSIFIVFLLFYSANSATSGSTGSGGIGLYIKLQDFKLIHLITLIVFWILHFLCYSVIIYKENKKSVLFWVINISLMIIPLFRVGSGRDFCMRASIPALFILMIYVIEFTLNQIDQKITIRYTIVVVFLGFALLSVMMDWGVGIKTLRTFGYESRLADDVHTFSNLDASHEINFLTENPEKVKFFKYLAKNKTEQDIKYDKMMSDKYFNKYGYVLPNASYFVKPCSESNKTLWCENNEIKIMDGENRIYIYSLNGSSIIKFENLGMALDVPNAFVDESGTVQGAPCNESLSQQWKIIESGDYYKILYSEQYALTYDGERVCLALISDDASQLWSITK